MTSQHPFTAKITHGLDWRAKKLKKKIKTRFTSNTPSKSNAAAKVATPVPKPPAPKPQFRTLWGAKWYDTDINDNKVFYESFSGNGVLCNPEAIFRYLLNTSDMQHLEHVWSLRTPALKEQFDAKFSEFGNVTSVTYESAEYYRQLSTAKYLINNATFQPTFAKRDGQIYLNTWHGTPIKKMGVDLPNGAIGAKNILRNFVMADYLLSPNPHTTKTMYLDAYRLDGIFNGAIIEEGYPRIDLQFGSESDRRKTIYEIAASGVNVDGRNRVVYAPTWKGTSFQKPKNEAHTLLRRMIDLENSDTQNNQYLIKVHQAVYSEAVKIQELRPYLIPNDIPTNEVLAITDILITDYSSIFFDFASTGKPILFFTPDIEEYKTDRGLYIDVDTLPGPSTNDIAALSQFINSSGTGENLDPLVTHRAKYSEFASKFCQKDDGASTARVVDIVFRNSTVDYNIRRNFETKKTKLLIFLGGMKPNGITTSALNLIDNLDYEKYDVSILVPDITKDSNRSLYAKIDPRARQFFRQGAAPMTASRLDHYNRFIKFGAEQGEEIDPEISEILQADWKKTFGNTRFDHIIDFSGYAGFWAFLLLQGQAESHSIWMHNDLLADQQRTVNGKRPNNHSLGSAFSSYQYFDNLVSVSPDLRDINSRSLEQYAPAEKFKSARNTINFEKILESAYGTSIKDGSRPEKAELDYSNVRSLVAGVRAIVPLNEITAEITRLSKLDAIIPISNTVKTFVSAGRLSPEKNHQRLIYAFSMVHKQNPNTRLVIMGSGPLGSDLNKQIERLELKDHIIMAGQINNPYEVFERADCFVLSSDYEGQPMVILEAMTLGLPVVTVEFGSARSALDENDGIIVEPTTQSLAEGMLKFLDGTVADKRTFDAKKYNDTVIREFYSAVGLE